MNDLEAAIAKRALELAEEFDRHGAELREMAGDLGEWQSLREFLLNVTGAIRAASDKDEMVRHSAFSLVVAAFDPGGKSRLSST